VSVRARLAVDIDRAWDMLHTPDIFRAVSAPFTVFQDDPAHPLPDRFEPDTDYPVVVSAGGIFPLGKQIIRLEDTVTSWTRRETVDVGRGVSGVLRRMSGWNHRMALEATPDGSTQFSDTLSVQAGWLTPLMWPGCLIFWQWRALRLRHLAKRLRPSTTRAWDDRYLASQRMWSGDANPWLVATAQSLPPGRALDVGSGEGADALWLAEAGWVVQAVDASAVALYRGHREMVRRLDASDKPVRISWRVVDMSSDPFPDEQYTLVSIQFLHVEPALRLDVWRRASQRVAPGGTLLIVGHSVKDTDAGVRRPPPELLFEPAVFDTLDPTGWTQWSVSERERQATHRGEAVTVWDVVLVAKR